MRQCKREAAGRSKKRRKRDKFVADPPLALIMGALALGMLVGALLAPGPGAEKTERPAFVLGR